MKKLLLFFVFCTALVSAQTSVTYDFKDGTIHTNGVSDDGNLTIVESNYHGTSYGLNLKKGHQINIKVSGSSSISFLGSKYSSLAIKGTTSGGGDLGTIDTQVVNDKQDSYVFNYFGGATTLSFVAVDNSTGGGSDVYLPSITLTTKDALTTATAGASISYDFAGGISIAGDTSKKEEFVTADNLLRMSSNTTNTSRQLWWHDGSHGVNFYVGNTIEVAVAGRTQITLTTCAYGGPNTFADIIDPFGKTVGQIRADHRGESDGFDYSFDYTGPAGVVTLKFVGDDKAIYIHGLKVEGSNGKTDVWDFGAEQLSTDNYNNKLTESIINGWYDSSFTVGASGYKFPGNIDMGSGVTWVGNGDDSDRLRTSNTNLTRYDESVGADGVTGRVYANGNSNTGGRRYFTITAKEYDVIEVKALSHSGGSQLTFVNVDDESVQNETVTLPTDLTTFTFIAKKAGTYKIFDPVGKLSVYRISRKEVTYKELKGSVDVSNASGIPSGYQIAFTNQYGKEWRVTPAGGAYSVFLPEGQTFTYALVDATGYKFKLDQLPAVTYDFTDQSIYDAGQSTDGKLRIVTSNFHGSSYGLNMKEGHQLDLDVSGGATVSFVGSKYSSLAMNATTSDGTDLGNVDTQVATDKVDTYSFNYNGAATTISFKAVKNSSGTGSDIYLPSMTVTPSKPKATLDFTSSVSSLDITILGIKADVWDFGAEQFDTNKFNNMLTESIINGLYDSSITPGSSGIKFPETFTVGDLTWVGKANSDRLRTTNTNLTRYDENIYGVSGAKGMIYANGTTDGSNRYFTIAAEENDEITIAAISGNGGGELRFFLESDPSKQDDTSVNDKTLSDHKFVAKQKGTYKFYDTKDKIVVYRVTKQEAIYQTLAGAIDITKAEGIPSDYKIVFTNASGKSWSTSPNGGSYIIDLPTGYDYAISLENANGYVLSTTEMSLNDSLKVLDLSIVKAVVYSVSGSVSGLGSDLSNLTLTYTPDPAAEKLFVPQPKINVDAATYSVELEADVEYTITASGVNDYTIGTSTITIAASSSTIAEDLVFTSKPTYNIAINASDLNEEQLATIEITFSNLNENGYSYSYTGTNSITLRDGTYTVALAGLDQYPIEAALISNLSVNGADTTKDLSFKTVNEWSFDDKVIVYADTYYKGMALNNVKNEIAKGHLGAPANSSIGVPMNPGEKMTVNYYYQADFNIDGGDAIITNSKSTGLVETIEYKYTGTEAGTVSLTFNATSYVTNIRTSKIIPFKAVLTVGPDKDFQTIGAALDAINSMERSSTTGKDSDLERVTVMIDPGNYEEMLVIAAPNVTLKNASANPSIGLKNAGVDIEDNAVRITSYYGYGYHYYSQGNDNKWNAEVLAVNIENGYRSNDNVSGTTKASYWNATVVVASTGFIAEDLILENSFNQYISKKESEDIVVEGSGSKGLRPTTLGDTSVQNRSFVERAAAIGVANDADKVILNKCRVVGRQDAFFGGTNARVVVYRGAMMGAVDYIFGGMTAVFYHTDIVFNTSDVSSDATYITAAQQSSGRGYLMYECNVVSTTPGVDTASEFGAKPGYFGRPWQANTSEVVFYNTNVASSTYPGEEGNSLISPIGWNDSLGGTSPGMYEFGTVELSGIDNSSSRASWATALTEPILNDGTEITTFNFTKGDDEWDPLPALRANDDTDGDTIVDLDEIANGTDPLSPDTDGDGKGDLEEGTGDFDGDGIIDAAESSTADADGDGLADERDAGNDDPLSDSDGDGYLDFDEVTDGQSNPNDAASKPLDTDGDMLSNLNDTDDDNDGLTDVEEAELGTDSTLMDTDSDGVYDNIDNCPTTANADQSDLDFDGIGDVCDDLELTVAEAITPNSDGKNDFWVIKNILNHPNSIIRVFNRSGIEVFNAVNYKNTWDGTNKAGTSKLPSASYYYTIDADGNGSVDHQGWVYIASN